MNRNLWILVLAVMMGAVMLGGSSAEAQDLCTPTFFCDRDGDGFSKEHKRCVCNVPIDCNDDSYDLTNTCGGNELPTFTATLTGPFSFDQAGPVVFTISDQPLSNRATNDDEKLNLSRCASDDAGCLDTWDAVFTFCSELLSGEIPTTFEVAIGNATLAKSSEDIRITFYDFEAFDAAGRAASMELHLIGTTDTLHYLGDPKTYIFDTVAIYGQSTGRGRKKKCQFGNRDMPGTNSVLTVP